MEKRKYTAPTVRTVNMTPRYNILVTSDITTNGTTDAFWPVE